MNHSDLYEQRRRLHRRQQEFNKMKLDGGPIFMTPRYIMETFDNDPWFDRRPFVTESRNGHHSHWPRSDEDVFSRHRRIFGDIGNGFTGHNLSSHIDHMDSNPRVRTIPIQVISEPRREFAEIQRQPPRFVDVDYCSDESDYDDLMIVGENNNNNGMQNLRNKGRPTKRRPAATQVRTSQNRGGHSTREGRVDGHSDRARPTDKFSFPPVLEIDDSLTECFRSPTESSRTESSRKDSDRPSTSESVKTTDIKSTPGYPLYAYLKSRLDFDNLQIDYIQGDGNCFFRALSKDIYGQESFHSEVRQAVVDVIEKYPKEFEQYLDSGASLREHINEMRLPSTWSTTMEIYAAATLLQRDIFVLSPDHTGDSYNWLLFQPRFSYDSGMSYHPCFIALCHTNGNHYDRIAAKNKDCNCDQRPPRLRGVNAYVDLTNAELSVC
ncbi:uncharacterized protein LOC126830265 [Patella vulgata]|uniref:uncharacterized protein LOC126830265 n=1 Tax=Patella vulgata TaxID=6465 RepID=UPI00217FED30|nr:uncharacterized protein LOC126830265 [Patella vulgata]